MVALDKKKMIDHLTCIIKDHRKQVKKCEYDWDKVYWEGRIGSMVLLRRAINIGGFEVD